MLERGAKGILETRTLAKEEGKRVGRAEHKMPDP